MGIFLAVGMFFAAMFNGVQADKPKQMLITVDGQTKMVTAQEYHKPVKSVGYNNDLGGGFYVDQWGTMQAK